MREEHPPRDASAMRFAKDEWWCVQSHTNRSPLEFPGNREIYREFRDFAAFGDRFTVKTRCAAGTFRKIPKKTNRVDFANIRDRNRDIRVIRPKDQGQEGLMV